ncbi:MAG: hypothetical protein F6K19_49035, partial [Cyanothece sp. SIO1E1]|nr:hypothetical protein [Cyanothece sp. SIO1E1]
EAVLAADPTLSALTIELEVLPIGPFSHRRSSIVKRTDGGQLVEIWAFSFKLPQPKSTTDMRLKYTYKEGINQLEYPDYHSDC